MFYRDMNYNQYFVAGSVLTVVFFNSAKIQCSDWVAAAGVAGAVLFGFGVFGLLRTLSNTKDDLRHATQYAAEDEMRRDLADRIANVERDLDRCKTSCCKKD